MTDKTNPVRIDLGSNSHVLGTAPGVNHRWVVVVFCIAVDLWTSR